MRHNSNSTGPKYGSSLQTGDYIGVFLDMVEVYPFEVKHFRELWAFLKMGETGEWHSRMRSWRKENYMQQCHLFTLEIVIWLKDPHQKIEALSNAVVTIELPNLISLDN